MSRHLMMPERERAVVRTQTAGRADVLDAWLGDGARTVAPGSGSPS